MYGPTKKQMKEFIRNGTFFVSLIMIIFLTGCGISGPSVTGGADSVSAGDRENLSRNRVTGQLRQVYSDWAGTPYLLGGESRNGIDCSAFTRMVFRDHFSLEIPRHTRDQLQSGRGVRRNAIQPGDLIFFRTSKDLLHVGISIGGGDFLHASVSSGVMISNVREGYWASRYLGTRRVLL
ncbi:MAG: hypothetical protein EA360_10610 [Balneolaceae bacterium]|nr:MAG: hypothetical protein EA360_10610 [Balneolaceae bacterium]